MRLSATRGEKENADAARFAAEWKKLEPGNDSWPRFIDRYCVRRNNAGFWRSSGFFNDWTRTTDAFGAGIDLSRYVND
jgi:hypothetical protein